MQRSLLIILFVILISSGKSVQSQNFRDFFRDATIRIDTSIYTFNNNNVRYQNSEHLSFEYTDEYATCEIILYPNPAEIIDSIVLLSSGSYYLIDSLINFNDEYYRFKVEFPDLNTSDFNGFTFGIKKKGEEKSVIIELKLLPYHSTYVKLYPLTDELFIGEEKIIELITNNIDNIRFSNDWQVSDGINYRLSKTFNQLQLHLVPNSAGAKNIRVPLQTKAPNIFKNGIPVYDLPPVEYTFNVKQSRIQYLGIDKREVTLDDSSRRKGIEVQIENSRLLKMGRTYRIEDHESLGGTLIAELITRDLLTNNKVLCWLRIYNYHRDSEGYLYIKDNDQAMFITNFNITPKTRIDRITILRDGNWIENLDVFPGEIIDLRIEGQGLHKARFIFEELIDITPDTSIRSENFALYKFRVPLDVTKNRLNLYNWANNTGRTLNVREFQEPRPFDYISVDYDGQKHKLSELPFTILVDKTIPDVIFSYDRSMIDSGEKLYGKQYLEMEITVFGRKDELIEMKTIENIVICPDINSPRYSHYDDRDCGSDYFNLNRYLRKKTHSLDIWSRISIKVRNRTDKYNGEGFIREFDLILRKDYSFDIELSFPAGLLTVSKANPGEEDQRLGQLTGISVAMIAQFSFYHPEKINTLRPFKVGAGFLALNAFNFSEEVERDVGLVILGSLYPTTKDLRLTFPLYFGGGYLLKDRKFFLLLGPGIRISF